MKVEVFWDTESYGTIELTKRGLVVSGNTKRLNQMIEDLRDGQSDEDFVKGLPNRLKGRTWAREVK